MYITTYYGLKSIFFWNWCNANTDDIAKYNQLFLRGFILIKLNPFQRVFAISAFLKVIHAPKTPKRGGISGTPKLTFLHIFFQTLAIRTSYKVYQHPHGKGFLTKKWKSWRKIFLKNFKKKKNWKFFEIFLKFFFSEFSLLG